MKTKRIPINEIILSADGCRTIIGETAHNFGITALKHAARIFKADPELNGPYQVWECEKGGVWTLKAAQSTREGALQFHKGGRVLVDVSAA